MDGNFARLELLVDHSQINIPITFRRGLNVLVFDPSDGVIVETASFDTHQSIEQSDDFSEMILGLENGKIVVIISKDDCSENLSITSKRALADLGSMLVERISLRDSFVLVGIVKLI